MATQTNNDRQTNSRKINKSFNYIIVSVALMLMIIISGIFAMKSIADQLQQSYKATNSLKSLMLMAKNWESWLTQSMKVSDGLSGVDVVLDSVISSKNEVEMHLKLLSVFTGKSDIKDTELFREGFKGFLELSEEIRKTRPMEASSEELLGNGFGRLYAFLNQIEKSGSVVKIQLDLNVKRLSKMTDFVLNGSLVSLLILGIGQILLVVVMSNRIKNLFKSIINQIKDGVSVINAASAEVQTTAAEVSTSVAETATSIAETTTTIEEIRQTALSANDKAQNLIHRSEQAMSLAERGIQSSKEMFETIHDLTEQMKEVVKAVNNLAEQNKYIGEITTTVSEIADQTNLLAVNAAIEAARAGEHGKGFSVVAQEIRNLSEQSKKSTIQVRQILDEIYKAVENIVEQIQLSIQKVKNSREQVSENQKIVETLAEDVEKTLNASMHISSSSSQQLAGLEQIVPAMQNIRQASDQNLIGIRQTQKAIEDVNELGKKLHDIMEKLEL
ncbi:hypothetical protein AT05_00100 [Schleiferia thermophila str. Yellowstone]|jgi:methyl-accepting chemotaxis protein|uniref:methyl-accepting chemotaxis protein n=1 Tax=Schleiferia thermophila TaxID=884107 RepID=UPI0004E67502|nr:methyl-accepting chemotaxis protein [Schleiferia thermophila]KFD40208.1 hypothetical protein AT05_00100 [Schleiferia thermophila str. Yellowstone]